MRADRPQRYHFWLHTPGGASAAVLHLPRTLETNPTGVVICPPFGFEYIHSHRSLLHLADDLARGGSVTLRLDYVGTGDSEGDGLTPSLVERWISTIEAAAGAVAALTGQRSATLIGLRLGALLAGAATWRIPVRRFVGWHPVVVGRKYVREQQALHGLREAATDSNSAAPLEAAGFVLARETAQALEGIDLRQTGVRVEERVLLIERDDLATDPGLAAALERSGIPTARLRVNGYLEMMAEPQYTVVPEKALHAIVEWASAGDECRRVPLDRARLALLTTASRAEFAEQRIREEHVVVEGGGAALRGILTLPGEDRVDRALVLPNAGSVHRVGPNRFYVELARCLASHGIACLRFDLRNLGESVSSPSPDENHPYPLTSTEDAAAALSWLASERGLPRLWLGGLCSGAHTAFRTGVAAPRGPLEGIVCINPLTFHWMSGMTLDTPVSASTARDTAYYASSLRSREKWVRLLRGQAEVGYIGRFALRWAREQLVRGSRHVLEALRLARHDRLAGELLQLASVPRALQFVLSSTDPGYHLLRSQGGRTLARLVRDGVIRIDIVEGADHTFSTAAWRRAAIDYIVKGFVSSQGGRSQ